MYQKLSDVEYFKIKALSSSAVKELSKSESHYHKYLSEKKDPTDAMMFGTACHLLLLDPDEFTRRVLINPVKDLRLKGAKNALEEFTQSAPIDAVILKQDSYNRVIEATNTFLNHSGSYLDTYKNCTSYEQSLTTTIDGLCGISLDCKIKADGVGPDYLIDYKTCQDASLIAFRNDVYSRGYHIQAAFYLMVHNTVFPDNQTDKFYLLAQESNYPYSCQAYQLSPKILAEGYEKVFRACKNIESYLSKEDKTKLNFYNEGVIEI